MNTELLPHRPPSAMATMPLAPMPTAGSPGRWHHWRTSRFAVFLSRFVLALLVMASGFVVVSESAPPRAVAGGTPGNEQISIPLRWCAVEGSSTADDPATTDDVLWKRHEDASENVWIPGASITFRSAFTREFQDLSNFPIIPDPNPTGPGSPGDIEQLPGVANTDEFDDVVLACEEAWDQEVINLNVPLVGTVAVNVRRFVDSDGDPSGLIGRAEDASLSPDQDCLDPPAYTMTEGGYVVVRDKEFASDETPVERSLAHELGHVLNLDHGNGDDDDDDGRVDGCDSDESSTAGPPFSIMSQSSVSNSARVSTFQRAMSRGVGEVYIGAKLDPPAALIDSDAIGDRRLDTARDVGEESTDLIWASLTFNVPADVSRVAFALEGLVSYGMPPTQYVIFADLDGDPATGGEPSSLGFTTDFQGAELVVRAFVEPPSDDASPFEAEPTVWTFDGSGFVVSDDRRIRGSVDTLFVSTDDGPLPQRNVVLVEMPFSVLGPVGNIALMQAIAEQLDAPFEIDILPGDQSQRSAETVPLFLVPPTFPVCGVTPAIADPGETVIVEATGLIPNEPIHVVFGSDPVAAGTTDGKGDTTVSFAIPDDARGGLHLVTVGVDGLALTADCFVEVFSQIDVDDLAPAATPAV